MGNLTFLTDAQYWIVGQLIVGVIFAVGGLAIILWVIRSTLEAIEVERKRRAIWTGPVEPWPWYLTLTLLGLAAKMLVLGFVTFFGMDLTYSTILWAMKAW